MESGSDQVLELLKKGVDSERQINAGKKAMAAGFEVSQYFMPGSGGTKLSEENARESARVLNEINPTFIRIRSTIPVPGTSRHDMMLEKKWAPLSEEAKVREIKLFIENLHDISSALKSDHIMNLIENIEGELPSDKKKMLSVIDTFFNMNEDDRESYMVGRRIGRFRRLEHFRKNTEIEDIKVQLKERYNSLDEAMLELLTNYI